MKTLFIRLLITTLLTLSFNILSASDYIKYHQSIAKAEEQIFVKGQTTTGVTTYLRTFNDFDFVFLHDCVNAMQIALYTNDKDAFLKITVKAIQNGLLPRHIKMIKYINDHAVYNKCRDSVQKLFVRYRPYYLKRLDTSSIIKIYSLFARDQDAKNLHVPGEQPNRRNLRYRPQIKEYMSELQELISIHGWPSDKKFGIDQADIIQEIAPNHINTIKFFSKNNVLDEYHLAFTLHYPIMIHFTSVFDRDSNNKRFLLYSDSFYVQQIKLGNMHPKDLALLYDMPFLADDKFTKKPNVTRGEKYFGASMIPSTIFNNQPDRISDKAINIFRAKYYIAPIENDREKIRFMKKNGMFIGWGYIGCRS